MRPVILVCTEIPSLPWPPNPFLLNALKLFHWSSLKAQSRHGMWTPLEGSTQLPRLQAGRRHCWFDEGGLRDPSKCPSCLLHGVCEAPQGGCQLQTHRFFLSPLMKLLSSVPSLSVCWTLSMCQMPSPFQHLWHCLFLHSKADDTTVMAESKEELKSLLMKVKEESEKAGLKLNIQKTKIMASSPITSWQIDGGKVETSARFYFLGSEITADGDCSHEIKRHLFLGRKAMTSLDSVLKSRDITLPTKVCLLKAVVFPVIMYRCESWTIKQGWALKNWCFWTVVLDTILESPLDCKVIKPVNPKGNQPWIFIGRTDAEAWAPYFGHHMWRANSLEKDPDAGKDWGQDEKGAKEDEMVRWCHQLNGHEFEQTHRENEGQGSLACCSPWGHKESDMTQQLNNDNHSEAAKGFQDFAPQTPPVRNATLRAWWLSCPALSRGSQMVSFERAAKKTSQERDTGDCSCALEWTQRLSRLQEAQLPHQHQGWPLLEAQGTPRRCTAAPPLSRYHSLSLAYYRSWLHTWSLHLKGRPSLPGRGRPRHLDHLPPPQGPLYLLVSSMGHGWGTKPSQWCRSKGPHGARNSAQEHEAWGGQLLRVRLREELSRWQWGRLHQGPRGCKF